MRKFTFEYRIVIAYLAVGGLWILFSDQIIQLFAGVADSEITRLQTYKGLFYVSITALLFFLFLKRHLQQLRNTERELESHRNNLQLMVQEKTKDLDAAIDELQAANEELHEKNEFINSQNTELKETLDHLQSAQAQLIQAEKMASLGVLTSGVAHEINNPLNFILGGLTGLEAVLGEKGDNEEKLRLYLESIQTGIERISSIVSGLNRLSSRDDVTREDCNLVDIMENCLNMMNHQMIDRISVERRYEKGTVTVEANAGQLHQAFMNILQNAVQAIGGKGTITVSIGAEDDAARVVVSDTGCGIDEESLKRITDPFFTTRAPGEGTGIGLAIVNNIVRAHSGEISFRSEQNNGTEVTLVLPAKKPGV